MDWQFGQTTVLTDMGQQAAALAAILALIGLLSKAPPVKWFFRRIIGEPTATWLRSNVEHVVEPRFATMEERMSQLEQKVQTIETQVKPNGGLSIIDKVSRIEGKVDEIAERSA